MQNEQPNPEMIYRSNVIVWFAILISQFLFVGLVYFVFPHYLTRDLGPLLPAQSSVVLIVLAIVSVTFLSLSFVLEKKYLEQSVTRQNVALVTTATITSCAFSEMSSLLAVLAAFAFEYKYFFIFSAIGIVGTMLHFPRRSNVHAASFKEM